MATFVYDHAKYLMGLGDLEWDTDTIKVALVGATTTCDTEKDTEFLDDFTTLDEMGDVAYARQTLGSKTITEDNVNNRAELDAANSTFSTSSGGDDVAGILIYQDNGADSNSIPIAFTDNFTAFTPAGMDVELVWGADGIIWIGD